MGMHLLLQAMLYAIASLTLSRMYRRTGHGVVWQLVCYLPPVATLLVYGGAKMLMVWAIVVVAILFPLNMLIYISLAGLLSVKRWPADQGLVDRFK